MDYHSKRSTGGYRKDFREDHVKSFEDLKAFIEDLTEKMHLKDYLVYKVCHECGLDLPRIDFRNDHCVFCSIKESQNE